MERKAPCPAAIPSVERKFHVLVGVTGSVAALKLPLLVSKLLDIPGLEVTVVTTERAKHFYSTQDVPVTLYSDADEWEMWKRRSDPVLHIDLRRWADLLLVAPLDANTLGKVASGICDNLLVVKQPPLLWDAGLLSPLCSCLFSKEAEDLSPVDHLALHLVSGYVHLLLPPVVSRAPRPLLFHHPSSQASCPPHALPLTSLPLRLPCQFLLPSRI
ncbi:phosphopantothenoylcysteine decarboxylase isoform X1 [Grammomys surdaster]|uniref:phosphopantothenoylcysteine decarboxylase isoform X1 n=1 Tax=Grammomys surdaster TaxID=491861 RepID=UPI0010A02DDD|nr:phosphopantothenoylcysteine decarboxylase isoform X1 [Grammomys surdaster]XP_028630289.1 phosphopantothenoylcysteine decarboxylase isoform X1 [Grammomys surdaster]